MNVSTVDTADDAFGSLVSPVPSATFFERFFERDVLHIARGEADHFAAPDDHDHYLDIRVRSSSRSAYAIQQLQA
jgi:hypothetical protein